MDSSSRLPVVDPIPLPCVTHFIALTLLCFADIRASYELKVCGNPVLSKHISTVFSIIAHFMSLHHILIILTVFQTFSLLLYVLYDL